MMQLRERGQKGRSRIEDVTSKCPPGTRVGVATDRRDQQSLRRKDSGSAAAFAKGRCCTFPHLPSVPARRSIVHLDISFPDEDGECRARFGQRERASVRPDHQPRQLPGPARPVDGVSWTRCSANRASPPGMGSVDGVPTGVRAWVTRCENGGKRVGVAGESFPSAPAASPPPPDPPELACSPLVFPPQLTESQKSATKAASSERRAFTMTVPGRDA
jgi:hypothetical protein